MEFDFCFILYLSINFVELNMKSKVSMFLEDSMGIYFFDFER